MANWYVGSDKYASVAQRANSTAYVSTSNGGLGDFVRPADTPDVDAERVYRCTTSGTSGSSPPASFATGNAKGATVADGSLVWTECTGNAACNETTNAWKAPAARIKHIVETWAAPGDNVFLTRNHDETRSAALSVTFNGTAANPLKVFSFAADPDGTNTPPPPIATAYYPNSTGYPGQISQASFDKKIRTTGASSHITLGGFAYLFGIAFKAANASDSADIIFGNGSAGMLIFDRCDFELNSSTSRWQINQPLTRTIWKNCELTPLNSGQFVNINGGALEIEGGLRLQNPNGVTVTTMFSSSGNLTSHLAISGTNFARGEAFTLIGAGVNCPGNIRVANCKLDSGVTFAATPTTPAYGSRDLILSDSSLTSYRAERKCYAGEITTDTVRVLSGGAADETTRFSWKMASSANTSFYAPLTSFPIAARRARDDFAISADIEIMTDGLTLDDQEIWTEIEFIGLSDAPMSVTTSSRCFSPEDLPVDHVVASGKPWATTGISAPVKQTIRTTFCPSTDGYVIVRVCLARPSTTVYVNPKIEFTEFVRKPKSFTFIVFDQPGTNMSTWMSHGTTVNLFPNYNADSQSTADWISTTVAAGAQYAHNAKGPGGAPSSEPDSPDWLDGEPANEAADADCWGYAVVDEPELGPERRNLGYQKLCIQEWRAAAGATKPVMINWQGLFIAQRGGFPRDNYWQYEIDFCDWISGDDYAFNDNHTVMYTSATDPAYPYTNSFVGQSLQNMRTGASGAFKYMRGRVYGQVIQTCAGADTDVQTTPEQVRFLAWSSIINGASWLMWFPLQLSPFLYNNTPAGVYTAIDTIVSNIALIDTVALFDQVNGGRLPYTIRHSADSSDAQGISAASYRDGTAAPTWSSATGNQMPGGWEAAVINGSDGHTYWIVLNMLRTSRSLTDATFGISSMSFDAWGVKCFKDGVLTNIFS